MSIHMKTACAVVGAAFLSACGGGGGGGAIITPAAPNAISAVAGANPVEARADVSRHNDGRIVLEMTEGPMAGMTLLCQDQSLGACSVVGGAPGTDSSGRLVTRLAGDYAFLGNFEVQIREGSTSRSTNQIVYSALPEQSHVTTSLPTGVIDYTGQFEGGFGLVTGESGQLSGTATMLANFDTGRISGDMTGRSQAGTLVSGNFNNLVIDPATQSFASTDATSIRFQQQEAWGDINGSFYGPNADEAAGVFNFGNGAGGMNGMFLTCEGAADSCIRR